MVRTAEERELENDYSMSTGIRTWILFLNGKLTIGHQQDLKTERPEVGKDWEVRKHGNGDTK